MPRPIVPLGIQLASMRRFRPALPLTREEIVDACLRGILSADALYGEMSGGNWLRPSAIDKLISAKISEEIYEQIHQREFGTTNRSFIVLDYDVGALGYGISDFQTQTGQRVPRFAPKQVDILLCDSRGYPWTSIFLKGRQSLGSFFANILNHLRHIQFFAIQTDHILFCDYIFGQYTDKDRAEATRAERLAAIVRSIGTIPDQYRIEIKSMMAEPAYYGDTGWWAGGSVCLCIEPSHNV